MASSSFLAMVAWLCDLGRVAVPLWAWFCARRGLRLQTRGRLGSFLSLDLVLGSGTAGDIFPLGTERKPASFWGRRWGAASKPKGGGGSRRVTSWRAGPMRPHAHLHMLSVQPIAV